MKAGRKEAMTQGILRLLAYFFAVSCFAFFLIFVNCPKPPLLGNIPFGKVILDKDGRLLRMTLAADDKYRIYTPFSEISPLAVKSALEYEDRYFYYHPGINIFAMGRALCSNLLGRRRMGASTLTMQVARLRFGLRTSSVYGKAVQICRALQLERHYTKVQLLEAYFNLAPYGGNIEGIGAAARIYFDQAPQNLVESEGQALAIIPQNPVSRAPVNNGSFEVVRTKLWKLAGRQDAPPPLKARMPSDLPFRAPHLTTALARESGEQIIRTTIDLRLQNLLENILELYIRRLKNFSVSNGCAMIVDSRGMEVRALAGSASFFDASIQGQIDGTKAKRSPGSTLKPFIYGLALDQGLIHPMSILVDAPRSFGGYDPQNFDGNFAGPVSAAAALRNSRNLPAISLSEKLANPDLYEFLGNAEIRFPKDASYYGLALTLGGAEMTMRELVSLYAMLANEGLWQPLRFTSRSVESVPRRLLSREAAWLVRDMLRGEEASVLHKGRGIPLMHKTGTSNGYRDAWTCGLLGPYVIAVWIGNFNNDSNPVLVGAKTALPLFVEIAEALAVQQRLPVYPEQPPADYNLLKTDVCLPTGDFDLEHCQEKGDVWIMPGKSPVRSRNILRPVLIDRKTGLRACHEDPARNDEVWFEFWPGDIAKIFEQAGISKPAPPEWLPECRQLAMERQDRNLSIALPKKNVVYKRRLNESQIVVPLKADADVDVRKIFWFADKNYLGFSAPGETIFWKTSSIGSNRIRAVEENGKAVSQICRIELAP